MALVVLALIALVMLGVDVWPLRGAPEPPGVRLSDVTILARFPPITPPGQLAFLAIEPSGNLVVSDRVRQLVLRFGPDGRQISAWDPRLDADTQMGDIAGVATSGDHWYVLDRAVSTVFDLDATGHVHTQIPLAPLAPYGPSGLAVGSAGDLYVADTGHSRILTFAPGGTYLGSFGTVGPGLGQLMQPITLAIAPDGALFVADWENARIERWQPAADGWEATSTWSTGFRPWGVAVDRLGRVYVPNTDRRQILVYAPDGSTLGTLGGGAPIIDVNSPAQVAFDPNGQRLYVLGADAIAELTLEDVSPPPPPPVLPLPPLALSLAAFLAATAAFGVALGNRLIPAPRRQRPALPRRAVETAPPPESTAPPSPGAPTLVRLRAWAGEHILGLCMCLLVVAVAAVLRGYQISAIPHGLHGDEAAAGLEGERILQVGWIGPYSGINLGVPTGPLYGVAVAVGVLGNTILAVRVVPVISGVLTVLALFVVIARNLAVTAAVVGSGILATLAWNVHLTRDWYNVAAWELLVVLAVGAVCEAVRTHRRRWWLVAGVLSGAGLYQYQGHIVVLAILGLYLLLHCVRDRHVHHAGPDEPGVLLFVVAVLLTALPMALFAIDPQTGFVNHYLFVTRAADQQRQQLGGPGAWLSYLATEYVNFWVQACCQPRVDIIDGTGLTPLAPLGLLVLVVLGIVLGLRFRRQPLVVLSLMMVALLPFAAITVGLASMGRRAFPITVFLALFAGLGVAELLALARRRGVRPASLGYAVAALAVGGLAVQGISDYFVQFSGSSVDQVVFVADLTDASYFMRALPPDAHVYFYAPRWSFYYETRQFLAPDVSGEDRSTEFGGGTKGIDVDVAQGQPVFVLIGSYRALLPEIQARYPGGTTTQGGASDDPSFIAYRVSVDN